MIEAAFVFTAVVVIAVAIRSIGIIAGHPVSFPNFLYGMNSTDPATGFILYPSMAFQIWFWANHAGLF